MYGSDDQFVSRLTKVSSLYTKKGNYYTTLTLFDNLISLFIEVNTYRDWCVASNWGNNHYGSTASFHYFGNTQFGQKEHALDVDVEDFVPLLLGTLRNKSESGSVTRFSRFWNKMVTSKMLPKNGLTAALDTRKSIPPIWSTVVLINLCSWVQMLGQRHHCHLSNLSRSSALPTWQVIPETWPGPHCPESSWTALATLASFLLLIMTLHPSWISLWAMPKPMLFRHVTYISDQNPTFVIQLHTLR